MLNKLFLCTACCVSILLGGLWAGMSGAWASPSEALIFPDSARVWEERSLPVKSSPGRSHVQISLPARADPQTLLIRPVEPDSISISEVQWTRSEPQETERVKELRRKIKDLQDLKKELNARIKAQEARIAFWEARKDHAQELRHMEELSLKIFDSLSQAHTELADTEQSLEEASGQLKELQSRLEEMTGPESRAWLVLVGLDISAEAATAKMAFNYILRGCGWEPAYRIEALPHEGSVAFTWEARVWQSSGQDWKGTRIALATLRPHKVLDPPALPDWIVRPAPHMGLPGPRDARMAVMEAAPDMAPVEERRDLFSVWDLGEQNLAAGDRPRLWIQEQEWDAEFVRLLRPSRSNRAFLKASLDLEQVQNIPAGEAMYFHAGAMLGRQVFEFTGTEKTIYFGEDLFVTAQLVTRARGSGARGIIRERQTYFWDFLITAANQHDYPLRVRLEEPRPMLRDERIEAFFKLDPEPAEETESMFIWELDLEPGQKREVAMEIELRAPGDMDIDWGWRSRQDR